MRLQRLGGGAASGAVQAVQDWRQRSLRGLRTCRLCCTLELAFASRGWPGRAAPRLATPGITCCPPPGHPACCPAQRLAWPCPVLRASPALRVTLSLCASRRDFELKDEQGGTLALIDRNFSGFGKEIFTDAGKRASGPGPSPPLGTVPIGIRPCVPPCTQGGLATRGAAGANVRAQREGVVGRAGTQTGQPWEPLWDVSRHP